MSSNDTMDSTEQFKVTSPRSSPDVVFKALPEEPKSKGKSKKSKGKGKSKVKGKSKAEGKEKEKVISQADAELCVELLVTAASQGGTAIRPDWSALATKLGIASGPAAAKRVERLLNRYDYRLSDITGGKGRGSASKADANSPATPSSRKRKEKVQAGPSGDGDDEDESPSKRAAVARNSKKVGTTTFKVASVFDADEVDEA